MKKEKLLEELEEQKLIVWHEDDWFEIGHNHAIDDAKQLIEYRIVCCKDCKWYEGNCFCRNIESRVPGGDWFCADGEKNDK